MKKKKTTTTIKAKKKLDELVLQFECLLSFFYLRSVPCSVFLELFTDKFI